MPEGSKTTDEMSGNDDKVNEAKIHEVWVKRIRAAEEFKKDWVKEGQSYKKFIEGDQWNDKEDILNIKKYCVTKANRMHGLKQGMVSSIAYTAPTVVAKPIRRGDDAMTKADVNSTFLQYCVREGGFTEHMRLVADDAIVYGAGFMEVGTDVERGKIPTARWIWAEDILIDPNSNTVPSSMSWIGYRFTMDVHTARRVFENPDLQPDREYLKGKNKKYKDKKSDVITLYRVYARADAVDFADADQSDYYNAVDGDGGEDEPEFRKALRKLGNRVYVFNKNHPKPIVDESWAYVLDHDEFPVTIVHSQLIPGEILPWSLLKPLRPLQKQINFALTYLITQARTTSQNIFVVNKEQADDSNIVGALQSMEINRVVFSGNMGVTVDKINMGSLNPSMLTMFGLMVQQFDQISGYQEMFGSMGTKRQSALEASIKADRADTLLGLIRQAFEMGMNNVMRHMLQIGFSVTSLDKVADIVGRSELDLMAQSEDPRDVISPYWSEEMTPEEIRSEVDIVIEAGSMRRVNREQEVMDSMAIMDRFMGIVTAITNQGYQMAPEEFAGKLNYIFKTMLDAMGREDVKQITFDPKKFRVEPMLMKQQPPTPEPEPDPQLDRGAILDFIQKLTQLPQDQWGPAMEEYVLSLPTEMQEEAMELGMQALQQAVGAV